VHDATARFPAAAGLPDQHIPPPAAAVAESSGARPEKNARQKSVNKRLYNDWTKRFEYFYQ